MPKPRSLRVIDERLVAIRTELLALEQRPEDELTDEDLAFQDTLLEEAEELETERKPIADRVSRMHRVVHAAQDDDNNEPTEDPTKTKPGAPEVITRTRRDPLSDEAQKAVRSGYIKRGDVISLAQDLVELHVKRHELSDDFAETATRRLEREWRMPGMKPDTYNLAQHVLTTGTPEYVSAFEAYLEDPVGNAQRTALSLTPANGGYLLPYVLDPTIVLTNASSANPYRRISRHETTTSNAWQGVNSSGVTAAWVGEGVTSGDQTPTVGQIQITPKKAVAWVFGSYEVLADTDFGQQLPNLLADARDRLEEAAFQGGNGTTAPKGITVAATTTFDTATTLVYAIGDVYAIHGQLPARFRNDPSAGWVMNITYIDKTRQFDTAGGASFWTNLGKGSPETLLGAPIYESTSMFGGTQAVGSLLAVYGAWNNYVIVDRVGVSMLYEPIIKDQATAFPTGQGGWYMFWRTGADVSAVNAFRVLRGH